MNNTDGMNDIIKGYMKSFLSYVNSAIVFLMGFALIIPVVYSYLANNRDSLSVYLMFATGFILVVIAVIKMIVLLNKSKGRI